MVCLKSTLIIIIIFCLLPNLKEEQNNILISVTTQYISTPKIILYDPDLWLLTHRITAIIFIILVENVDE